MTYNEKMTGLFKDYELDLLKNILPRIEEEPSELIYNICTTGKVPDLYHIEFYPGLPFEQKRTEFDNTDVRLAYNRLVSWCLVNNLWINDLYEYIKGSKVIELYAGRGLISKLLKEKGLDITAYDDYSWYEEDYHKYTDVIEMDAIDVITEYDDNSLDYVIMSWIPYKDKKCVDVVKQLKIHHPNCKIIYIGEPKDGMCASDEFFDLLDGEYSEELNQNFQAFDGIHDAIYIMHIS